MQVKTRMVKIFCGLFLFTVSAAAQAQQALSAQQAVEQLYAQYLNEEHFVYFADTGAQRIVSQRLAQALEENDRYVLPGDMGFSGLRSSVWL